MKSQDVVHFDSVAMALLKRRTEMTAGSSTKPGAPNKAHGNNQTRPSYTDPFIVFSQSILP